MYYSSNLCREKDFAKAYFKRLLLKLTTEYSFQFNHQLLKQVESCTMGGPLSITLAEIHMIRMEKMLSYH